MFLNSHENLIFSVSSLSWVRWSGILGMVLTMRAQIRFSGLNYVGQVAEYAAHLTEDNTAYQQQMQNAQKQAPVGVVNEGGAFRATQFLTESNVGAVFGKGCAIDIHHGPIGQAQVI